MSQLRKRAEKIYWTLFTNQCATTRTTSCSFVFDSVVLWSTRSFLNRPPSYETYFPVPAIARRVLERPRKFINQAYQLFVTFVNWLKTFFVFFSGCFSASVTNPSSSRCRRSKDEAEVGTDRFCDFCVFPLIRTIWILKFGEFIV